MRVEKYLLGLTLLAAAFFVTASPARENMTNRSSAPTYTQEQAEEGAPLFAAYCASCHGERGNGGEAPSVAGPQFQFKWDGKSVLSLYTLIKTTMPTPAPGSLSEEEYTNILAFMFRLSGFLVSTIPLSSAPEIMSEMRMPALADGVYGHVEPGVVLPPAPDPSPNPLDRFTPVTEAMLARPADQDWLTWRRELTAGGYSPLKQIDKTNVSGMKLAWSWPLPNGANEATPLVHDGVLFAYGYGDVIQALDASTGDLLWEYSRQLPKGVAPSFKKAIALSGGRVFSGTADGHVVALDAKTGDVVWDVPLASEGHGTTGGPLVAKDKIIVGTSRYGAEENGAGVIWGRGLIVALDLATGKEAWRFDTIPAPGEPGGDTWNGLPMEKRSGGTVWNPGSYDPELDLVFFGPAPTYDTAPLRNLVKDGKHNNDALYTNATLALNPDTGKLEWYYQHLPNDQWDFDVAFERQIVTLSVNDEMKKVVVTAGKDAIHDVLDARTGKYLFSLDPGLQNLFTRIDPQTGKRTIDASKIPGDGKTKFVCPNNAGGRGWMPSAINPNSKVIFVSLVESCMYMTPVMEGDTGMLSTGVRISLSPREGSDGLYGRLQAINLQTRKTEWTMRKRAPLMSGVLATAGGLVFAGSLDRVFSAYDDSTGKELWSARLSEMPNSGPISYAVNGKQYVAVVVGGGGSSSREFTQFTPEFKTPLYRTSAVWVFALPDNP